MNDEIKEIIDMFTKYKDDWYSCEYKLKPKQCVAVLDYITNLQQENEDYKSRCEKAIEYINKNKHLNWYVESIFTDDLLNILNGGDEE